MYLDQSSFCNEDTLEAGEHTKTANLPLEFFFFFYSFSDLHVEERQQNTHTTISSRVAVSNWSLFVLPQFCSNTIELAVFLLLQPHKLMLVKDVPDDQGFDDHRRAFQQHRIFLVLVYNVML